jgi:hypothetical protein
MRAIPSASPIRHTWRTAGTFGAAGLAVILGSVWLFRSAIVDYVLTSALGATGAPATVEVADVGFGRIRLGGVKVGAAPEAPGFELGALDARWTWTLGGPRLASVVLERPVLTARLGGGKLDLGGSEQLFTGGQGSGAPRLPEIGLTIREGRVQVMTASGALSGALNSQGVLGRDFAAEFSIAPTSLTGEALTLTLSNVAVQGRTENGVLRLTGAIGVPMIRTPAFSSTGFTATFEAEAPADLTGAAARLVGASQTAQAGGMAAKDVTLTARTWLAPDAAGVARPALQANAKTGQVTGPVTARGLNTAIALKMDTANTAVGTAEATVFGAAHPMAEANAVKLDGLVRLGLGAAPTVSATIGATAANAKLTQAGQKRATEPAGGLEGLPLAPLGAAWKSAIADLGADFALTLPAQLEWRGAAGRLVIGGPVQVSGANGATISVEQSEPGRPILAVDLPSGDLTGRFGSAWSGGGLPPLRVTAAAVDRKAGAMTMQAKFSAPNWSMPMARVSIAPSTFDLTHQNGQTEWILASAISGDSEGAGVALRGFEAPLNLVGTEGPNGIQVSMTEPCATLQWRTLETVGLRFDATTLPYCQGPSAAVFARAANGTAFGGVTSPPLAITGRRLADAAPVSVRTGPARTAFSGRLTTALGFDVTAPAIDVKLGADRTFQFAAAALSGATRPRADGGGMAGRFTDARLSDPTLPVTITQLGAAWGAAPENGRTVIRLRDVVARVEDILPPLANGEDPVARFNPLHIAGDDFALIDSVFEGKGDIFLADDGKPARRRLAGFSAKHELTTGEGAAEVMAKPLQFSNALDLYEVTELARGVVDSVEGPVTVNMRAAWDQTGMTTGGEIRLEKINLASRSLGPVDGISGTIALDDLLKLTTEPGQVVTIDRLNPGVKVDNGTITLQLLGPDRVLIEDASWPFAGGELAIEPQEVTIGAKVFRMRLVLRKVDAAKLLEILAFKDIAGTGRIEGGFDLRFDGDGGFIERSTLRADAAGGRLSYTGDIGADFTGMAKVGFDALKSFAYDNLAIEISGFLDGDIISAIRFEGENILPVNGADLTEGVPFLPGVKRVKVAGVPFKYQISVRAPFRDLIDNYQGTQDARPLVQEALEQERNRPVEEDPARPVDGAGEHKGAIHATNTTNPAGRGQHHGAGDVCANREDPGPRQADRD